MGIAEDELVGRRWWDDAELEDAEEELAEFEIQMADVGDEWVDVDSSDGELAVDGRWLVSDWLTG